MSAELRRVNESAIAAIKRLERRRDYARLVASEQYQQLLDEAWREFQASLRKTKAWQ